MTDITKCIADHCPIRYTCFRYTAPAGDKQSYADFSEHLVSIERDDMTLWECQKRIELD